MKGLKMKRWFWIIFIVFSLPVIVFLSGVAWIYYNQEELVQRFVNDFNEQVDGRLLLKSSRISPFAQFPYTSIDLRGIAFYMDGDLDKKPVYSFSDLYIGFDLKKAFAKQFEIKKIKIRNGQMEIIQCSDGSFDILTAKSRKEQSGRDDDSFIFDHLEISTIRLENIDIKIEDESLFRQTDIQMDHFTAKIRYIRSHLYIDMISAVQLTVLENNQPTFFREKNMDLDLELDYDPETFALTIYPSAWTLNDAAFKVEGSIDLTEDYNVSLEIRGDKPDFGIFAAFLPPETANALLAYQNAGKIFFQGKVEGALTGGRLPLVEVDFGCENAWFLNKNVNKKVEDLYFSGSFTNGRRRNLQTSVLRLDQFSARPEEGVFEGRMVIRNFLDPQINVDLHADLDLEFLGQFFQIKDLERIRGKILLDMKFDEIIDLNFPGESLAQLKTGIDSDLTIKDLYFTIPAYPYPIEKLNGHATMRDGYFTLDSLFFIIDQSDLKLSGSLTDLPALYHKYDKPVRIELEMASNIMDFPSLLSFDSTLVTKYDEIVKDLSLSLAFETNANELFEFEYLPKGEFFIDDLYITMQNYPHTLHDFHADIYIDEQSLKIIDFSGEIDSTNFLFTGKVVNYPKWFQDKPMGDSEILFDLQSSILKINDLLTYKGINYLPESYRDEVVRELNVRGRVDLHYDEGFQSIDLYLNELTGKMNIHPMKLEHFKGRIHWERDQWWVENFSGRMGRSDFLINLKINTHQIDGTDTRDYFHLKSNVLDLDALIGYQGLESEMDHETAFNWFEVPFPNLSVKAEIGKMNYHKYWLENVHAAFRIRNDHFIFIDTFSLQMVDGRMGMKGYFNGSDPEKIYFHSIVDAHNLDIDKLMVKFDNFGQDQLINENIHGRITGKINSTFRMHPDFTPILEESEAHMELMITEGSLVNFAPMRAMSRFFQDKNLNIIRFDTLRNVFDLSNGTLSFPRMNINSSLGFMEFSGRQNMDLSMEYFMRVPLGMATKVAWRKLFGSKNPEEVDPDQIDDIVIRDENKKVRFVNVKVVGTPENYKISLGKDKKK